MPEGVTAWAGASKFCSAIVALQSCAPYLLLRCTLARKHLRYDQGIRRRRLSAEIIRLRMPVIAAGYAGGCAATRFLLKPRPMKQRRLIRVARSGKLVLSPWRRGF